MVNTDAYFYLLSTHLKNKWYYTVFLLQLSSDPNIVIAKMDATANDVPQGYDVQGYVFKTISVHSY